MSKLIAGGGGLGVVVDRWEVESGDVSGALDILGRVIADRSAVERYRGRVDLSFDGYASDSRELHEISEVRRFCAKLDDEFPFWFYFLSTENETLRVIAYCLCSVTQVRPGVVSVYGPDMAQFMVRHFGAMNWLFDHFSLDERLNVEISRNVDEYFGGAGGL